MKRIALVILAHVDSGKTTLSEALLCSFGEYFVKSSTEDIVPAPHKSSFHPESD